MRLNKLYQKLTSVSSGGQIPSLSTYYRVGFHSSMFGALDNKEYIYREPSLTQLSEITTRLTTYYTQKLGVPVTVMKGNIAHTSSHTYMTHTLLTLCYG